MSTVRATSRPKATPDIRFSFSPTAGDFTFLIGATVYEPDNALLVDVDTPITFTATATFPNSDTWPVSYEWDFGDGIKGYGNPVDHTYHAANPHTQAVLTVIDNRSNRIRVSRILYLQEA